MAAKILVVEDDKMQAGITKSYLEASGYDVILAEDGKSAIKIAKTTMLDIILLDLVLPDMDGNEVSRWLKLDEETKGVPIIMLTAKTSTLGKVNGLRAGADDYLSKPYNENELTARINASLRTKALQDELKEKNRKLEELLAKVELLAITDHLTGLFNRRHFELLVENEFNPTQRYKTPTSCLMADVDYFKSINDEYGHRAGDMVLKELAEIIKACLRNVDTIARWGGEEFVILLPRTNREDASSTASRILSAVSGRMFSGIKRPITISIGGATIPHPSIDSAEKFIDASDNALYKAKAGGRNRIEFL
jgi:two-component system, cell cycle response regulator